MRAAALARRMLGEAASKRSLLVYLGSAHPVQSAPLPLNGTHVNVSTAPRGARGASPRLVARVFNHIRNHLPELIALTANTPVVGGKFTGLASTRLMVSRVLTHSKAARVKRKPVAYIPRSKRGLMRYGLLFRGLRRARATVLSDDYGRRLLDITPRGPSTNVPEDIGRNPGSNRVEVRALDNQLTDEYLSDVIKLIAGLALEAYLIHLKGEDVPERPSLEESRRNAAARGIEATLIGADGKPLPAREAALQMIGRIEPYLEEFGLRLESPIKEAKPEVEVLGPPRVVDERHDLTRLEEAWRLFVSVKLGEERALTTIDGGQRFIPRGEVVRGVLFPEFRVEFEVEGGLVRRYRSVERRHWLATPDGYLELRLGDEVLRSQTPLGHLASLISRWRGLS